MRECGDEGGGLKCCNSATAECWAEAAVGLLRRLFIGLTGCCTTGCCCCCCCCYILVCRRRRRIADWPAASGGGIWGPKLSIPPALFTQDYPQYRSLKHITGGQTRFIRL